VANTTSSDQTQVPPDLGTVTRIRLTLLGAGFNPVACQAKVPVLRGWQTKFDANREEIASWATMVPEATNTGVLTRWVPTLDVDITDPDAVDSVKYWVRDHYADLGKVLEREGRPPQCAIPFRTDTPFKKIAVDLIAPNGHEERLEFLGDGQQFIARGIHPDTQRPYAWFGGRLGSVCRSELPPIDAKGAQGGISALVGLLCREHGYQLKGKLPTVPDGPKERREDFPMLEGFVAEGHRDCELTRVVGLLFYRRRLQIDHVRLIAHSLNKTQCQPPLEIEQVDKIVDSVRRREEPGYDRRGRQDRQYRQSGGVPSVQRAADDHCPQE
jgi:hypothetical protein